MNKDLMITQQDLIDWIDRPPSNDDLNLATFISTRLENFYKLQNQLQQKENIIKEVREEVRIYEEQSNDGATNELDNYVFVQRLKKVLDKEVN